MPIKSNNCSSSKLRESNVNICIEIEILCRNAELINLLIGHQYVTFFRIITLEYYYSYENKLPFICSSFLGIQRIIICGPHNSNKSAYKLMKTPFLVTRLPHSLINVQCTLRRRLALLLPHESEVNWYNWIITTRSVSHGISPVIHRVPFLLRLLF